jgi:hypothetical protein
MLEMCCERTGGVLQFVQKPYTYLVNYNKNKEILTAPIKTDNGSVDGH